MPDDDDLSEFEEQMADVTDPSGFRASTFTEHNGERVFELVGEATDLIVEDCIKLLNDGKIALSQYMLPSGFSITGAISSDGHTVTIVVQTPGDQQPFVAIERLDKPE